MTSVGNRVHTGPACHRARFIQALAAAFLVLVAASAAQAQYTVTATWDRNTDTFTTGYRLFYGTSSGTYQWSVDVGNVTSAPLNLAQGRYYFTVRGYNASSQYGPASNEATLTVGTTPAPTATIQASLQGTNTAVVTWQTTNAVSATLNGTAVPVNGSTTIAVTATTTFTLVARNSSGATATASATVTIGPPAPTAAIQASLETSTRARVTWQTTNAVSATINGAPVAVNGTTTFPVSATTTFTLVARNASGATATANATVTIGAAAPTAAIQASLETSTRARVTWQTTNAVSATINGAPVPVNGSTTFPVSTTTTFTLVARNASGSTATANATVTIGAPAPTAAIQASLDTSTRARVTWQTTNAVSATINGAPVPISGYTFYPVSTTTTFTLVARNASGATATASATVTVGAPTNSPPLAPVNVRSTVSGSRVTVSWQPNPAGGVPTEYFIYVGTSPSGAEVINGQSLGNVLSVTSTLPNGTYYVRLRARNAYGSSLRSDPVSFRIGAQLTSPTDLTASWNGTQTTLTWVASAADSLESAPTSYVLQAGTAPGLSDVAEITLDDTTTFTADVPYGVYYVRVRAINGHGDSDPTEDLIVAAPGTARAPEALSTDGEGATVTLSWVPPDAGGEAPAGYLIEAGSDRGLSDIATIQVGNVTSFTTEAPPGTYFVRVRAINSRGPGLPSNEVIVQK